MKALMKQLQGLTLIEVLVAMAVLSLAIVGIISVTLNSVKVNDMAARQLIARETAGAEIERIKLVGYHGIRKENINNLGYVDNLNDLGGTFTLPGIPTNLDPPYDWDAFRGVDVRKEIGGQIKHYFYTLRLSVEEDFVEREAKRGRMEIYWIFQNKLRRMEVIFVVGRR